MNTKDSEARTDWQGIFVPQEGCGKTGTKTADCRASPGICKVFPPAIHRFVHKRPGRQTVVATLQICDSEIVSQRSMEKQQAAMRSPACSPG
jgi:hypothetical protein